MKRTISAATLMMISVRLLLAGCVGDCKDEYDSAVASCKLLYDQPSEADDLQECVASAKAEYQSCIEDCNDDD